MVVVGLLNYMENNVEELWEELSILLVTEELLNIKDEVVGLSICLKKNNFCVVKIWNKNCKNNSIKLLKILKKKYIFIISFLVFYIGFNLLMKKVLTYSNNTDRGTDIINI